MRQALYQARTEAEMTQEQVAASIGVTKRHYSRLENGESAGSMEAWRRLSRLFNQSIDDLSTDYGEQAG